MIRYLIAALLMVVATGADALGRLRDSVSRRSRADRGQLGIFMVLVFGAVALVVVTIVLLFGMDIAGDFANNINTGDPFTVTNETHTVATFDSSTDISVNRQPDTGDTVSLNDDETVYNETGADASQLTEGTGYDFFPDNGTLRIYNVSSTQDGNGDPAGTYAITYTGNEHQYAAESQATTDSTGNAFQLFGTSVLVIPAAAVLAVLMGGLVGAVTMLDTGSVPGAGRRRSGGGR